MRKLILVGRGYIGVQNRGVAAIEVDRFGNKKIIKSFFVAPVTDEERERFLSFYKKSVSNRLAGWNRSSLASDEIRSHRSNVGLLPLKVVNK